jgi:hypothetical protein
MRDAAHAAARTHVCSRLAFLIACMSEPPSPVSVGGKRAHAELDASETKHAAVRTHWPQCVCGQCSPLPSVSAPVAKRVLVQGIPDRQLSLGDEVHVRFRVVPAGSFLGDEGGGEVHAQDQVLALEETRAARSGPLMEPAFGLPEAFEQLWEAHGAGGRDETALVALGRGDLDHIGAGADTLLLSMREGEIAAAPLAAPSDSALAHLRAGPGAGALQARGLLLQVVGRAGARGSLSLTEDGGVLLQSGGGDGVGGAGDGAGGAGDGAGAGAWSSARPRPGDEVLLRWAVRCEGRRAAGSDAPEAIVGRPLILPLPPRSRCIRALAVWRASPGERRCRCCGAGLTRRGARAGSAVARGRGGRR